MGILSGVSNFFGLDIGTSAIRLVELSGTGQGKSLVRYAYAPVDSKIVLSDSKADRQKLAQVISELISSSKVTTRNVAVGISSNKVFTTIVDMERLPQNELAQSIKLQADSLIPTPPTTSKLEWVLLGDSPVDKTKSEVLISSVSNDVTESILDVLESIGLNVIAFEPDNLAIARSLFAPDNMLPQMAIDVGAKATDLVLSINGAPRLARSIPTGTEAIIRAAMQNLSIDEKQAEQFVFKFGLSKDKLEGQVFQAISGTVELLVSEIEKSIKFVGTRYPEAKLDRIIVSGGASALPEFPLYLANKTAANVEIGNAWRNVSYPSSRQNELLAVSNHFAVAAGLAERSE